MKIFKYHIALLLIAAIINLPGFCQSSKPDKNIMIAGFQTEVFYSNEVNLLGISSAKDSIQNLVIKSSQGDLQNADSGIVNGFLSLINLKNGKVVIRVFAKKDTGLLLLSAKTFSVITRPLTADEIKIQKLAIKPEINIEGFKQGKISLHNIKNATKFTITQPYKIKTITVYFGSYAGFCSLPLIANLSSENFDTNFKNIWKRLAVGSYIHLDPIYISDKSGNTYRMNPIDFRIDKE